MYSLDTNTVSYYFRGDPQVVPRLQGLAPSRVAVPAIVAYELRYGLMRLSGAAAEARMQALEQFLGVVKGLDFDDASSKLAARIRARLECTGQTIGPNDLLIAATAMAHGCTLVTRNVREFARVDGLLVENWHSDMTP